VPSTPRQARAWLARHPHDDPESRGARAWAFLVLGDLESARRAVERMPGDDPPDRYRRAVSEAVLRLAEGADPALDQLRRVAAALDPAGRRQAEVDAALLEAQRVAGEGGDWRAPLLAVRPMLGGGTPARVILRLWLPSVAMLAIGAAAMTAVAYLFSAAVA
jgi:hypothetical protein